MIGSKRPPRSLPGKAEPEPPPPAGLVWRGSVNPPRPPKLAERPLPQWLTIEASRPDDFCFQCWNAWHKAIRLAAEDPTWPPFPGSGTVAYCAHSGVGCRKTPGGVLTIYGCWTGNWREKSAALFCMPEPGAAKRPTIRPELKP